MYSSENIYVLQREVQYPFFIDGGRRPAGMPGPLKRRGEGGSLRSHLILASLKQLVTSPSFLVTAVSQECDNLNALTRNGVLRTLYD